MRIRYGPIELPRDLRPGGWRTADAELAAKLAQYLRKQDHSVLFAAADTYRAGAIAQLQLWAERLGVPCVSGAPGGDPAAVAFDAIDAADALVLEDYNKGVLTPALITPLMQHAKSLEMPTVVDPKYKNFFAYSGATIFKPNRRELESALGAAVDLEHVEALPEALKRLGVEYLLLTLGEAGMALIAADDIGKTALGVFRRGDEFIGKTVSIAGTLATGEELAAMFTAALSEKVVYRPLTTDQIRASGQPIALEMANMFQFYSDASEYFTAVRDLDLVREFNPELQPLDSWLAQHENELPLD